MNLADWVPVLLPWVGGVAYAIARAAGLLLAMPQTSAKALPQIVVAITTFAVSISLVGVLPPPAIDPVNDLIPFTVQLTGEFLFGLGLGFVLQLALAVAQIAGEIVGVEMGLSFAAVADPLSSSHSTAPASMFAYVAMQLLLALGLDRTAIRALAQSVKVRPLGTANLDTAIIETVIALVDRLLEAAFSLALPIVGAIMCLKLAMAMLARVAPKLQIFSLSFALTIGLGLLIMNVAWPALMQSIAEQLQSWTGVMVKLATTPQT